MTQKMMFKEKVVSYFGYWPKFCDGKICSFLFDEYEEKVHLDIDYIDTDKSKRALVKIVFSHVSSLNLDNFRNQNILDELIINEDLKDRLRIDLISCYGLSGSFECGGIEVKDIVLHPI